MSETRNVSDNNDKVFAQLEQQLSAPHTYRSAIAKFRPWLQDVKAYYVKARPKILRLLQVAEATLKAAVNYNPESGPFQVSGYPQDPMVQDYVLLLNTVAKHVGRFSEPELRNQVERLLKAMHKQKPQPEIIDLSLDDSPPSSAVAPKRAARPLSVPSSNTPLVPSSGSPHALNTNSLSPPKLPPIPAIPPASSQPAAIAIPTASSHPATTVTPQPVKAMSPVASSSRVATTSAVEAERPTTAPGSTRPAKSKLKRKRLLADDLLKADLSDVMSAPKVAVLPKVVVAPKVPVETKNPTLGAPEVFPPPREGLSRGAAIDLSREPAAQEGPRTSPKLQDLSSHELRTKDVSVPREGGIGSSGVASEVAAGGSASVPLPSDPVVSDATTLERNPLTAVIVPHEALPSNTAPDADASTAPPLQTSSSPSQPKSCAPELNVTQPEEMFSDMEVDNSSDILEEPSPKRRKVSIYTDVEEQVEQLLSSITKDVDKRRAADGRSPLHGSARQSSLVQPDLPPLELPARKLRSPAEVFASSIRLLMIRYIKPGASSRIEVGLEISSDMWRKVALWTERRGKTSEQVASSRCFSLGCCSAEQFLQMNLDHPLNLGKLCSAYPQAHSWPTKGKLRLTSQTADPNTGIELDPPPLLLTVNGLVDISFVLTEGTNRLCLDHGLSESSHVLFMIRHAPTPVQLETFASECRKDEEWKDWIESLTKGIRYPLSLEAT